MNDLMQQTGNILAQSQELLKQPEIRGAVSGFLSWIGSKIFANKKAKQERLALIEKQKADEQTINDLKSDIRSIVEDNEELQKELAEKVKEVELLLKKANVQITKTNTANITGNSNKVYQDIQDSTIIDKSINQTHSGTGDIVGRDKIDKQYNIDKIDNAKFE
jgi:predicted metal-dependent hydrolase